MTNPTIKQFPKLLLAALVAKGLWLSWLGFYGYPHTTSDSVCFKQPAYMRMFTPYYSIPSYAGRAELVDKINSYPAAIYTYLNYTAFRVFGVSQFTSNATDLAVHFSVSALGAWALWRLTARQLPALLFLLGSSQWLLVSGRPEELGILFVLLALVALERGAGGLVAAIVGLGLAGATTPGAAIVGTVLLVSFDGLQRNFDGSFRRRAWLLVTVPLLISGAIYIGYVYPYVFEAWQQDRALRADGLYSTASLPDLILRSPLWAIGTLSPVVLAIILPLFAVWRQPRWFPRDSTAANFVIAAGIATVAGLLLNAIALRLKYDYRHITALALASCATCTSWWTAEQKGYALPARGMAAALMLFSFPLQQDIVRLTLAPLVWPNDSFDYRRAQEMVLAVVPAGATVGGDGNAWAMITDGRPFLIVRTVGPESWPEYVISTTWGKPAKLLQSAKFAQRLHADYEEVTPSCVQPDHGSSLNLLGLKIPVARGRADWYLRIWKRRTRPA